MAKETSQESDALRDATLKKLLATPPKPKSKSPAPKKKTKKS